VDVFLTRLTLLMPTFSLPSAPPRLTPRLLSWRERSPTAPAWRRKLTASVAGLSPVTSSARHHSTS